MVLKRLTNNACLLTRKPKTEWEIRISDNSTKWKHIFYLFSILNTQIIQYDQPNTTLCDYAVSVVVFNIKSQKSTLIAQKKDKYKNTHSKGYTHTIWTSECGYNRWGFPFGVSVVFGLFCYISLKRNIIIIGECDL